jgi:AcrR family transcriptional regulator
METTERKLTPRGRERRRQLLDYAAQRFAENGYHPTSVADIVNGLGVGKGVFYWYFDSKEQLFLEILRESQTDLRRFQRDALGAASDPIGRLEIGVRASFTWWSKHPEIVNLLQFAATESAFSKAVRRGADVSVDDIVTHIREGIATGAIRDADPEVLAHAVLGITGHLAREFVHRRGQSPDEIADLAVTMMLDGLRG